MSLTYHIGQLLVVAGGFFAGVGIGITITERQNKKNAIHYADEQGNCHECTHGCRVPSVELPANPEVKPEDNNAILALAGFKTD